MHSPRCIQYPMCRFPHAAGAQQTLNYSQKNGFVGRTRRGGQGEKRNSCRVLTRSPWTMDHLSVGVGVQPDFEPRTPALRSFHVTHYDHPSRMGKEPQTKATAREDLCLQGCEEAQPGRRRPPPAPVIARASKSTVGKRASAGAISQHLFRNYSDVRGEQ